jgi:hypothetical protein
MMSMMSSGAAGAAGTLLALLGNAADTVVVELLGTDSAVGHVDGAKVDVLDVIDGVDGDDDREVN